MAFFKQQLGMFSPTNSCIKEVIIDELDPQKVDFERQARLFCTYLIERMPSGTVQEFAKITGMDPDKVMTAGIKIYHNREEENENYKFEGRSKS